MQKKIYIQSKALTKVAIHEAKMSNYVYKQSLDLTCHPTSISILLKTTYLVYGWNSKFDTKMLKNYNKVAIKMNLTTMTYKNLKNIKKKSLELLYHEVKIIV
jgi:hypothetical protein